MLDRLLKFEEQLARIEALLLVVFVLLMLGLATYNVFYRNVLVPIQVRALTSDEPAASAPETEPVAPAAPAEEPAQVEAPEDDGAAGFGGGFGEEAEPAGDDAAAGFGGDFEEPTAEPSKDDAAGFGGDFAEPATEPAKSGDDAAAGFGGDFGDTRPEKEADDAAAGFGGDFGEPEPAQDEAAGGFGGDFEASADQPSTQAAPEPSRAPAPAEEPPAIARIVDAIKIEWIDVVLRQLVLVVGFLGAMLATRRRKHITIDALSKLLSQRALYWTHVLTNTVSLVVCAFLVAAAIDLVEISREFPKELVSWADEWHFQLAFPIGFGMLSLHFAIRIVESVYWALGKAEPPEDPELSGAKLAAGGEP